MNNQKVGDINDSDVKDVNVYAGNQLNESYINIDGTSNSSSYWISLISLIISISSILVSIIDIRIGITSEFFISLIASLMGICATILVGLQIYNSIEFNRNIKELNKRQEILSKELEDAQNSVNLQKSQLRLVQGISVSINQQYLSAIYSFFWAMRYAIMANNVKTIKVILDNTKRIYNDYIRDSDISNLFEEDDKDIKDKILSIDLNNLPKNDENLEDINAFKKIISDIVDKLKKQS